MKPQKLKNGFTLVEMVLSISLIGILFAFAGIILTQGIDSYAHISERQSSFQEARYAFDRMIRELIIAGEDPADRIQGISNTQIDFMDDQGNNASFTLNNQVLQRSSPTATQTLLRNVSALTFTGYNSSGNVTSSPAQIRRLRIQLSTLPAGQLTSLNLRTDLFIRNYLYEQFQ